MLVLFNFTSIATTRQYFSKSWQWNTKLTDLLDHWLGSCYFRMTHCKVEVKNAPKACLWKQRQLLVICTLQLHWNLDSHQFPAQYFFVVFQFLGTNARALRTCWFLIDQITLPMKFVICEDQKWYGQLLSSVWWPITCRELNMHITYWS